LRLREPPGQPAGLRPQGSGPHDARALGRSARARRGRARGGGQGAPVSDKPDFGPAIAEAYKSEGPAVVLGRGVHDGAVVAEATVQVPLSTMNRHGLVAGATGTGKTKTLQAMAEQLSAAGVPVFVADVKGDVSGLAAPADAGGPAE